jgi:hypothetical protein
MTRECICPLKPRSYDPLSCGVNIPRERCHPVLALAPVALRAPSAKANTE